VVPPGVAGVQVGTHSTFWDKAVLLVVLMATYAARGKPQARAMTASANS
jgi:hypothetical protein